jgi:hypothetical protein
MLAEPAGSDPKMSILRFARICVGPNMRILVSLDFMRQSLVEIGSR